MELACESRLAAGRLARMNDTLACSLIELTTGVARKFPCHDWITGSDRRSHFAHERLAGGLPGHITHATLSRADDIFFRRSNIGQRTHLQIDNRNYSTSYGRRQGVVELGSFCRVARRIVDDGEVSRETWLLVQG